MIGICETIAWCVIAATASGASVAPSPSTVLLVHFDGDVQPAYSLRGDTPPAIPRGLTEHALTYVPGRFGQAVRLERQTGASIGFDVKGALTGGGGTIEFWYRPEWDPATILGEDEGPEWLRGKPVRAFFISNQTGGSGVRFFKNQYNILSFVVARRYKTVCFVSCRASMAFGRANEWRHLAVSWDRDEARLFANGRLLTVSDAWDLDYFQSPLRLGGHSGGAGAFDELRVSREKLYVSSFTPSSQPLSTPSGGGETDVAVPRPPARSSAERSRLESARITFYTDFSGRNLARFARGDPRGRSNRALGFRKEKGRHRLRLGRRNDGAGDTLGYEVAGNLNRFLGTFQARLTLSKDYALPFTVFDSTHWSGWDGRPVGVQLVVNETRQLEWRSIHGTVVSRVISPPMELLPGTVIELGCSWKNSEIALYRDGVRIAMKGENVIPPRIGRYFFIGSNCLATHTLCGDIHEVVVRAADGPVKLPLVADADLGREPK